LNYLTEVKKQIDINKSLYNKYFLEIFKLIQQDDLKIDIIVDLDSFSLFEEQNDEFYGFKLNKEYYNFNLLLGMTYKELKELEVKIIDMRLKQFNIHFGCLEIIKDLETISLKDIKSSKYSFLFEEV